MFRAQFMFRFCVYYVLGVGFQLVFFGSLSCREVQFLQKNVVWVCGSFGGLCVFKNVWGKLLISLRCNMNILFQGKWLFWDKQFFILNFVFSRFSFGLFIQVQVCLGNKVQRDCLREFKLVVGDIGQYVSFRVWNDFRMEFLKVKLFYQIFQILVLVVTFQFILVSFLGFFSQE